MQVPIDSTPVVEQSPKRRVVAVVEIVVCVALVAVIGVHALSRMDYLGGATAGHIRMTDESRTAYVAKNLVDGNGYSANDLPSALVDFYDHQGKLSAEHWPNADRFPFAAYATAVLYTITHSTSWEVGILVYNLICFIGFLALLYVVTQRIFDDRYAAILAVTLALLHPYTYVFLYWKDSDMLLLITACIALLYRYFQLPPGAMTKRLALGLGTVLGFIFLSRPNLGSPIILFFGITMLRRWWRARRELGTGGAVRQVLPRELLVLGVALLWCVPFMIQSMREWGQPLFSANNLYQLPLGTRYGMGTDTWWKYSEPGKPVTLGMLIANDAGELLSKFTTSWVATLKDIVSEHALELLLACVLFVRLSRDAGGDGSPEAIRARAFRMVAVIIGVAFVANLALLPLYGYQNYSYRHYLSFILPLLWIAGGRTLSMASYLWPQVKAVANHVKAHAGLYVLIGIAILIAWNLGAAGDNGNRAFLRTSKLLGAHWVAVLIVLAAVLLRRQLLRPPWAPRVAAVAFVFVYSCYRPNVLLKRTNFVFSTENEKVFDELGKRHGLVSSFALQGEVAWKTGRKNIPAPEWPMHIYSFLYDHKLEVEDVYIESASALISRVDGPFSIAAPGFEGYARLQQYLQLPGYEVAFHDAATRSYPKFKVGPHAKASTDFRLVDRNAVKALAQSPERIELGDPKNVIYTAHGWDRYYVIDGVHVVAGTDATSQRYALVNDGEAPWEDASVTLFLDQRHPNSIDVDFYAPAAMTYQFYWNLDLYAYDPASARPGHLIGSVAATGPGWQHAHLAVPAKLTRTGLNKLGFRTDAFHSVSLCPKTLPVEACVAAAPHEDTRHDEETRVARTGAVAIYPTDQTDVETFHASLFMGALKLNY